MSSLLEWLVQNEPSFRKTRLPSLYSDLLVQKTSNPDGYAANVTAWQVALTRAAVAGQLPSDSRLVLQSSDELLDALSSTQYGRPSGLGSVFDEAVRNGKMIDLKDFSAAERSMYDRNWVPSPWSILQWSLRQIGLTSSYDVKGRLKNGNLVLVQALEEVSKQILAAQEKQGQGLADRVMSREMFLHDVAAESGQSLSASDASVILRYLSRDKPVLSYDAKTVKFKAPASLVPAPITEEDTAIASLKSLIASLSAQTQALTARILALQSTAQAAVKSSNKTSALSALRSKKLAEKSLQQRSDTLHQLEDVYTKIEQAADQVEIVNVMEASAGVLKGLHQKVGGVERVDEVMDRLRKEMEHVDEVSKVTTEPLTTEAALDEGEIDEELEAMEAEQTEQKAIIEAQHRTEQEEREAETTRKRLDELGRAETPVEERLERSTKRLSLMDIEDQGQGQGQGQRPGQTVAEPSV